MIRANRASLHVESDTYSASDITAMLRIEPDHSGDIGDPTPAGRAARNLDPHRLRHQRTCWPVTETDDGEDAADKTESAALSRLVHRLLPRAHQLAELRTNGETVLWWSADSASSQGGFVFEADLIGSLHTLGCSVYRGRAGRMTGTSASRCVWSHDGDAARFAIGCKWTVASLSPHGKPMQRP